MTGFKPTKLNKGEENDRKRPHSLSGRGHSKAFMRVIGDDSIK
jgi:hypothetical protein